MRLMREANSIGTSPDDRSIRVFGDHDDKTVQQLYRCVAAEEGARGVLCADGHVGYSQPIGGVVAYREHVSPSGAGGGNVLAIGDHAADRLAVADVAVGAQDAARALLGRDA